MRARRKPLDAKKVQQFKRMNRDFIQKNTNSISEFQKLQELSMASNSLAMTIYRPVIWPLLSFTLALFLHDPLSAVRDFGGVGVTGEFPALSHRFLLILQRDESVVVTYS